MNFSFLRLRLVVDYISASKNEIAVDSFFLSMASVPLRRAVFLPRVPRWIEYGERFPQLTILIFKFARVFWLCGGAIIFLSFEYCKNILLCPINIPIKTLDAIKSGAVLGLSSRVSDVIDRDNCPNPPLVWIRMPWAPQNSVPKNAIEVSIHSLIKKSELRDVFVNSIIATYLMTKDPMLSKWVLQSYTAFQWFLVRKAIDKISGTLIMVEHYDRWAVLVDRSIRADLYKQSPVANRRLVLIQHGILGKDGEFSNLDEVLPNLFTRLQCVEELYSYDSFQEEIFLKKILCAKLLRKTGYFSPSIKLSPVNLTSKISILFVGHPMCEKFQSSLCLILKKKFPLEIYYKPHPQSPMSGNMKTIGWTVIDDPLMFPEVDFLISYPSTLVMEYQSKNITAVLHTLGEPIDQIDRVADRVEKTILSRNNIID